MKEVYVLSGIVHYEGHSFLGVYSTKEKAEEALKDFDRTSYSFDEFVIEARDLDGAAAF